MYEHGQSNVSIISEIFIAPVLARKQLSLLFQKGTGQVEIPSELSS